MQEDDNPDVGADAGEQLQPMTPPTEQTEADPPAIDEPMGPVQATERIHALDVLRGFAIFGIFMVNIAFFAMPFATLADPTALVDAPAGEKIAHGIVRGLFELKFVSLFSMLFGIGLIVQMRRADQRRQPFVPLYLRRVFVLMGFGFIHAFGLWYGDILLIYSFVALAVMWLRGLAARWLVLIAAGAMGLSFLLAAGFAALGVLGAQVSGSQDTAVSQPPAAQVAADMTGQDGEAQSESPLVVEPDASSEHESESADPWDRFGALLKESKWQPGDPAWAQLDIMAYKEGPMGVTLVMRAFSYAFIAVIVILSGFGFRIAAMFLLGMALMKLNFFDRSRRRIHAVFAAAGLLIGLSGESFLVAAYHATEYQINWTTGLAEFVHNVSSLALCLGYVGAITLIVNAGLLKWLTYAMSCVGRTALSNYLLQTIVATYIMYWWGLGLFNEFTRPQQLLLVVSVYAAQLVLSVLYLRVFRIGPFEWLWRSLTYWKTQPIIR